LPRFAWDPALLFDWRYCVDVVASYNGEEIILREVRERSKFSKYEYIGCPVERHPHPTNGQRGVWLPDPMRWKSLDLHKFHLDENGSEIAVLVLSISRWLSRGTARRQK